MTSRRLRLASTFLLLLLLADSWLASCAATPSIRRSREDAWLLSITGYRQLSGTLPATAWSGQVKVGQLARLPPGVRQTRDPNEVWRLLEYYEALRAEYEQRFKAAGKTPEEIKASLAGIDAKISELIERGKALEARRARHRGTAWKRAFDWLGRRVGGAFDAGGKVVKFVIQDVPGAVAEIAPDVLKAWVKQYIEKLKESMRGRLFDILSEKAPGLAQGYLVYKLGRSVVQIKRDFERQFGRQAQPAGVSEAPSAGAVTEIAGAEDSSEGAFTLPTSGAWTGACDSGRDDAVESWCEQNGGELTHEPVYTLTIDYGAGTFTFTGNTICVGPKATDSFGSWSQVTTTQELQGGGKLYPDGWLVGIVDVSSLWLERGVRVKIGGSESYEEGGPTTGTVPLTAYIDGDEDLDALDVFFTSGGYGEAEALDPDWLRSIGWDGVVDWLRGCEACYTVCRPAGGS